MEPGEKLLLLATIWVPTNGESPARRAGIEAAAFGQDLGADIPLIQCVLAVEAVASTIIPLARPVEVIETRWRPQKRSLRHVNAVDVRRMSQCLGVCLRDHVRF